MLTTAQKKLIQESLEIEQQEAMDAGAVGYMARVLTQATLPHRNPKTDIFRRSNGNLTVSIADVNGVGLPYGSLPRLILAWVTTEAVLTKSRHVILGESLSRFMAELGLVPTGGRWGSITRLKEQLTRLFACSIGYKVEAENHIETGNMAIAQRQELWWEPSKPEQLSMWESYVELSEDFFNEVVERPVPVDKRALEALRTSPMAIDIYTWLTYRLSYLERSAHIPWEQLQMQFGAGYSFDRRGLENFQRAFTKHLKSVQIVYPGANVETARGRLVLKPSKPHISKR